MNGEWTVAVAASAGRPVALLQCSYWHQHTYRLPIRGKGVHPRPLKDKMSRLWTSYASSYRELRPKEVRGTGEYLAALWLDAVLRPLAVRVRP